MRVDRTKSDLVLGAFSFVYKVLSYNMERIIVSTDI